MVTSGYYSLLVFPRFSDSRIWLSHETLEFLKKIDKRFEYSMFSRKEFFSKFLEHLKGISREEYLKLK